MKNVLLITIVLFILGFSTSVQCAQMSDSDSNGSANITVMKSEKSIVPDMIKNLPNVPDVEKITDIAEQESESVGWGTYGGIIILLLAAVIGLIRKKRK